MARESVCRLPLLHTEPQRSERANLQIATLAKRTALQQTNESADRHFCMPTPARTTMRDLLLRERKRICKHDHPTASTMVSLAMQIPHRQTNRLSDNRVCNSAPRWTRTARFRQSPLQLRTQRSAHGNAQIINFASRPSHGVSECGQRTDHSTCCRKSWKRSSLG